MGAYIYFKTNSNANEVTKYLLEENELNKKLVDLEEQSVYIVCDDDIEWAKNERPDLLSSIEQQYGTGSIKTSGGISLQSEKEGYTYKDLAKIWVSVFEELNKRFEMRYYARSCSLNPDGEYFDIEQLKKITDNGKLLSGKTSKDKHTKEQYKRLYDLLTDNIKEENYDLVLNVESSLPKITTNFDAIKQSLQVQLSKYDLIVQEDDVKVAKKAATKINKVKNSIATIRKDKVNELSKPINDFISDAKELEHMCEETRQKLLIQVSKFEDKKREECLALLKDELILQYEKLNLKEEFQNIDVSDLAIISNLNKGGISKKAKDEIESRVLKNLEFQKTIETRLLELKGYCLEKGLQAPLTKENVELFLYSDNKTYVSKLDKLIDSEISRLKKMQKDIEDKAKRDAENQAKLQARENAELSATNNVQIQKMQPVNNLTHRIASNKNNGSKCKYIVTATFEIEVDEKYENRLVEVLQRKFENAVDKDRGVKSFNSKPKIAFIKEHKEESKKVVGLEGSLF